MESKSKRETMKQETVRQILHFVGLSNVYFEKRALKASETAAEIANKFKRSLALFS